MKIRIRQPKLKAKIMLPRLNLRLEHWKYNKDYEVWVSSEGNFLDKDRNKIKPKIESGGYLMVQTKYDLRCAHRVVMNTFCPRSDAECLTVDHLNHNKRDNSLRNLEWVTKEENLRRAEEDYVIPPKNEKYIIVNDEKMTTKEAVKRIHWAKSDLSAQAIADKINHVLQTNINLSYGGFMISSPN